jgi:hypothetical protein
MARLLASAPPRSSPLRQLTKPSPALNHKLRDNARWWPKPPTVRCQGDTKCTLLAEEHKVRVAAAHGTRLALSRTSPKLLHALAQTLVSATRAVRSHGTMVGTAWYTPASSDSNPHIARKQNARNLATSSRTTTDHSHTQPSSSCTLNSRL